MTTTSTAATGAEGHAAPRRRRLAGLVALTTLLPLAETVLVKLLGLGSATVLAPQLTGPAMFGSFHDLRWIVVYHQTWWGLALIVAAGLVFRSLFTATAVRLAWPDDTTVPPFRRTVRAHLSVAVAAYVVLAPWVTVLFGMSVVALSTLYFFATIPLFIVLVVTAHANVDGAWWRHLPSLRAAGWVALTFVVYVLASTAVAFAPDWADYLIVVATGVHNAWMWVALTTTLVHRQTEHRWAPVGSGAVAVVTAAMALVVSFFFGRTVTLDPVTPPTAIPDEQGDQPVLVIQGFNSRWDGRLVDTLPPPYLDRRYSYRGLNEQGLPQPYLPEATHQSLEVLVRHLDEQVDQLARATGQEVSLVAESEGTLIAKAYLGALPDAPVDTVILSSPLVDVADVYYPPQGTQNWGLLGGWGVRGMTSLVSVTTGFELSGDAPFFRSILDLGPALRDVVPCPPPSAEQFIILPLAGAVTTPPVELPVPVEVVPALHGATFEPRKDNQRVVRMLNGDYQPRTGPLDILRKVAAGASLAWRPPELALGLNPVWDVPDGVGQGQRIDCDVAFELLREALLTPDG